MKLLYQQNPNEYTTNFDALVIVLKQQINLDFIF